MLDETPIKPPAHATPSALPESPSPTATPEPGNRFDIGEEFGTAKRNLPPAKIVLTGLVIVVVVATVVSVVQRAKPQGAGSIDNVTAAEVPNQNMMLVAVTVTLHNSGNKPIRNHNIKD